jgi:L-2-hydroxyglutarate oxidase
MTYDYCIIGAGIIGLSTAYHLVNQQPNASIVVIEKERELASHQSGHNSGVIHAGIYYAPGSLKAKLCKQGLEATKNFCIEHGISYTTCGKLIVATNEIETLRTKELYKRAISNDLNVQLLTEDELKEKEPNITGNLALFSPETGIVDYRNIASKLADIVCTRGSEIENSQLITRITEHPNRVEVGNPGKTWFCKRLIVCGGLQADRLAKISGIQINLQVIPFRGEYYCLPPSKQNIVNHLIYPAPDPELPFLGVHLTKQMDGSITVGPNAVLGFSREGYNKHAFNLKDSMMVASYPGFWKFIWTHRHHAIEELKSSLLKKHYLKMCQKYCPQLTIDDLMPHPAGIRAQLINNKGIAVHDFLFKQSDKVLHVLNAPSPAATSALPIGRIIAAQLAY